MEHLRLVYLSILLTLFSLILSQSSDGGDGGSSDATTQSLVTLPGRVDDGLAMSPIANAQGRKCTDASEYQDIQGALVPPIDRATNLIVCSADANGRITFILAGDTPLVSTQVGWSVLDPAGARLLGQVHAPFVAPATLDALVTVPAP